ncbi:hypothetical protein HN777_00265 [Candidatus Woesearchaeota archaeon]|jgi:hypothetical protein|nr:hypothetical protein [Candidatus Woesearchaeota archaeon]
MVIKYEKLNQENEIFRTVLEIFVEAGSVPSNYHRAGRNKECDLAIGPDHDMVRVYKPVTPEDNYK